MIKVTSKLVPTTKEGVLVEAKHIGGLLLGEQMNQDAINQKLVEMSSHNEGKLTEITSNVSKITGAISWEVLD